MVSYTEDRYAQNGRQPSFIRSMLRADKPKLEEHTPTLFIKVNKVGFKPQKAWLGFITDIHDIGVKVYYTPHITKEVPIEPSFEQYKIGWYFEEAPTTSTQTLSDDIDPPFFKELARTSDWRLFEDGTYKLLKLLGLHETSRFLDQKGQPDGFFRFKNLTVIYDCTLEGQFASSKESQIRNYCSQLESGSIKKDLKELNVARDHKEVWIITQGESHTIRKSDQVTVKEVSIDKIIDLYRKRISKDLGEDELEDELRNI